MSTYESRIPAPTDPSDRFSDDRIGQLIDGLEAGGALNSGKKFSVVVLDGLDDTADIGRSVEYARFDKEFDNGYDEMEAEYRRFDAQSIFITVVDMENRKPAGVVRFIKDGPEGFKTVADVADSQDGWGADMLAGMATALDTQGVDVSQDLAADKILDVASMARAAEYDGPEQGKTVSAALYRQAFLYGLNNGYKTFLTIMDEKPFLEMQQNYLEPYVAIDGIDPAPYLGSVSSLPCYCHIPTYFDKSAQHPQLGEFVQSASKIDSLVNFAQ